MAMGHTEGKGKRVGRGHLSVRVPRWAALVEEPQGAHRPGRVARPRVLSSASRTRTRGSWWWRRRGPGGFRLDERLTAHRQSPTPTAPAAVPRPGFGRVRGWNVQVGRIIDRIGDRSPALAPPARGSPAPPNYTEPRRMQRPPARQPDGLRSRRRRERRVPAHPMPSKVTT